MSDLAGGTLATTNGNGSSQLVPSQGNPAVVYLGHLGASSRPAMASALAIVAELLCGPGASVQAVPWQNLRYSDTAALRSKLIDSGKAPAYVTRILCALRGTLKAAWKLGLMTSEDYTRAIDLEPVKGSRLEAGREVATAELGRLLASCRSDSHRLRGLRDGAIVALLYGAGLRRSEAASLPVSAVDLDAGHVRVLGKGNRERLVPLPAWAVRELGEYVLARGTLAGAFLLTLTKDSKRFDPDHYFSGPGIYGRVVERATLAGVDKLGAHDMRRAYATQLLEATNDLTAVQGLLGHARVTTTERYLKGSARRMRKAALQLPEPTV